MNTNSANQTIATVEDQASAITLTETTDKKEENTMPKHSRQNVRNRSPRCNSFSGQAEANKKRKIGDTSTETIDITDEP